MAEVANNATAASLDMFLESLLRDGRIDKAEYHTAMSLAQHQDKHKAPTLEAISCAVFRTVELAEQIFSYLDFEDLVNVSTTCHNFRDIANTTPLLRRKLFLQADEGAAFQVPVVRNVRYGIVNGYVEILIVNAGKLLHSSALQAMLLTQPPPRAVQIFYDCACRARDAGSLVDAAGLTFGHAAAAIDEHFSSQNKAYTTCRTCHCPTYLEARLIFKLEKQESSPS